MHFKWHKHDESGWGLVGWGGAMVGTHDWDLLLCNVGLLLQLLHFHALTRPC